MRKSVLFAAGFAAAALAAAGAVAGAGVWAAQPCRPLDRLFGWSGCAGSFTIENLASLRRTLAFDPKRPDLVYAAGVSYDGYGRRDRLDGRSHIVALDFPGGSERWRGRVDPDGVPEVLVMSPDGSHAALSCNRIETCDFAPNVAPGGDRDGYAPVGVVDLAKAEATERAGDLAKATWMRPVPFPAIPIDGDGRSAEPRFSRDGKTVSANGSSWTLLGDPAPAASETAAPSTGWDEAGLPAGAGSVVHDRRSSALVLQDASGAETRRMPLELPDDFGPALRAPVAVSPDGARAAILSRRFSGPGEIRAFLQIFRLADGKRLSRVALDVDVAPALLFSPSGDRVLVATAPEAALRASTTVRLYLAGDGR